MKEDQWRASDLWIQSYLADHRLYRVGNHGIILHWPPIGVRFASLRGPLTLLQQTIAKDFEWALSLVLIEVVKFRAESPDEQEGSSC